MKGGILSHLTKQEEPLRRPSLYLQAVVTVAHLPLACGIIPDLVHSSGYGKPKSSPLWLSQVGSAHELRRPAALSQVSHCLHCSAALAGRDAPSPERKRKKKGVLFHRTCDSIRKVEVRHHCVGRGVEAGETRRPTRQRHLGREGIAVMVDGGERSTYASSAGTVLPP